MAASPIGGAASIKRGDFMPLTIQVGYTTEDPRKLDKSANFNSNSPVTFTATVKENCSAMNPDFIVSASLVNLINCNYLHCESWARYYFIEDMITMPGGRIAIRCREDVLTSNAGQIGNCTGYLVRTATAEHKNKYIADDQMPVQERRYMETYAFNKSPFTANFSTDGTYVLCVIGGNHNAS